jgi:hypothetical protein
MFDKKNYHKQYYQNHKEKMLNKANTVYGTKKLTQTLNFFHVNVNLLLVDVYNTLENINPDDPTQYQDYLITANFAKMLMFIKLHSCNMDTSTISNIPIPPIS